MLRVAAGVRPSAAKIASRLVTELANPHSNSQTEGSGRSRKESELGPAAEMDGSACILVHGLTVHGACWDPARGWLCDLHPLGESHSAATRLPPLWLVQEVVDDDAESRGLTSATLPAEGPEKRGSSHADTFEAPLYDLPDRATFIDHIHIQTSSEQSTLWVLRGVALTAND